VAERLLSQDGSPAVRRLVDRQIREPGEEARLSTSLPRLTPLDAASAEIHAQYEENPYPRWVRVSRPPPSTLPDALRAMFPHVALPAEPATPDILIAGCGTGQHAIETALRFRGSRVLAVDLSVASLAYALRKTREHGLTALDYGQADIMQLGRVGRQFDVIEAVGVLHHMDDPIAGWRILTALLRPGGFMKIGLYSARARAHIVRVRSTIAEAGYRATAGDIRRCRQALFDRSDADARRLAESPDFYSLSGCRDLLFNAREQHFSLPDIARTLDAQQLAFVGFEIADEVKRLYRVDHPGDRTMTDLGGWDGFESKHPETFRGMYQFWVRRG
jgi:SAM-dependent methyltransferase